MTRIYEALQHASDHPISHPYVASSPAFQKPGAPIVSPLNRPESEMDGEMLGLYQAVESLLSEIPRKLVLFIGSVPGEGTSTLARNFATLAAEYIKKRVLLFDADSLMPNQKHFFGIDNDGGWQESSDVGRIQNIICQIGSSRLYLCPSSSRVSISPEIFDTQTITTTLENLRESFDLVVIDAPPPGQSPDGLALAPHVDGVILVVEAENTRWKVAENTKNRLLAAKAKILGMVYNKRHFHIPDAVYRLLG